MLIIVSGPSGAGKNTIVDGLMKRHKKLHYMKTCTTRPDRGLKSDLAYYHISKEEFDSLVKDGKMFEYENADIFYGTPFASLEKVIEGKYDYIKDIDVHGTKKILDYLQGKAKVVSIFVDAPNSELKKRLTARGEKPDMIEKRLSRAAMERRYRKKYDYCLINEDVERSLDEVETFVGKKNFKG